jgi:hypothetical protein
LTQIKPDAFLFIENWKIERHTFGANGTEAGGTAAIFERREIPLVKRGRTARF